MEYNNLSISSGSIAGVDDQVIKYDLYAPISGNTRGFPVILFAHGFKGFKDWGAFPDACEDLARYGFGVVGFNFSHNGIGNKRTEFDQLDVFAESTLTKDLQEIGLIIDAIQDGRISNPQAELNTDDIGIVGHSRGGHTAIAAAAEYESIKCLVTWAAVADYTERTTEAQRKDWEENGFTEFKNSRTGQMMKLNKAFIDDLDANKDTLVAITRVSDLVIPALFIHGRDDESVPYTDSEKLYIECGSKDKELRLIANAGHTFCVSHPFEEEHFPPQFEELVEFTGGWFRQFLR